MTAATKPARGAGKQGMSIWGLGLATGICLALAPGAAALGGILLVPAILVFLLDQSTGKAAARPVFLCGFATIVTPGLLWWSTGPDVANAVSVAAHPERLAFAWSMQGIAWLGIEVLPALIRITLDTTADARTAALRRARRQLEEEWGIPPSGPDPGG